jgi:hypothetical protein
VPPASEPEALLARVTELERRLDRLALTNRALVEANEALYLILGAEVEDEVKRGVFREILSRAKMPTIERDLDAALLEGRREGRARKMRELLAKARG